MSKGIPNMSRMNDISLSVAEKQNLGEKIENKMKSNGFDALLVFGSSNITYLSCGIVFPYLDQKVVQPVALYICYKTGKRIIVCTNDLADIPKQLNWNGEVVIYNLNQQTPELSIAKVLKNYITGKVAIDENYMTTAQIKALKKSINGLVTIGGDQVFDDLKLLKTDAEIRLLEIACRMGDRGFVSALNHSEGAALDALSYPLWEYAERFRVHVGEYGGSCVGNMVVVQGEDCKELYARCEPSAVLNKPGFVRLEYSLHNSGYWVTGSRTVYLGQSNQHAEKVWENNQTLKNIALKNLRPGIKSSEVYNAVRQSSEDLNIPFWGDIDLGHGVGTKERERPFLAPYDDTLIAEGMVIVLGVYTYGNDNELICNKDVYLVTNGEPRLLNWYKSWNDLYVLHGTSARHG